MVRLRVTILCPRCQSRDVTWFQASGKGRLHAFGIGRTGIEHALAAGEIQRIRQGWYANPWLPPDQARAARIGGQLACGSAAETLGLWTPRVPAFHV